MALNPIPVGQAIAAFMQANKPTDGTPVTTTELEDIWIGVMTIIYNDIKANGTVPAPIAVLVNTVTGIGATTSSGSIL